MKDVVLLQQALLRIHAALDDALGDTDITHLSDRHLRQEYPVQWAAQELMKIINSKW